MAFEIFPPILSVKRSNYIRQWNQFLEFRIESIQFLKEAIQKQVVGQFWQFLFKRKQVERKKFKSEIGFGMKKKSRDFSLIHISRPYFLCLEMLQKVFAARMRISSHLFSSAVGLILTRHLCSPSCYRDTSRSLNETVPILSQETLANVYFKRAEFGWKRLKINYCCNSRVIFFQIGHPCEILPS